MKIKVILSVAIMMILSAVTFRVSEIIKERGYFQDKTDIVSTEVTIIEEEPEIKSVKISAVGDCTIGWDPRYGYETRYDKYLDDNNGDYGYYFAKVKDLFAEDDLTIANLEGCFTNSKKLVPKEFNLSAPPEFKETLVLGNIDIVSFANNHTHDYGVEGYEDTIEALESINMPYYSYDKYLIKEVNGIKMGFFALWDEECKNYDDIDKALSSLKNEDCDLIIASMHWGIERMPKQNDAQIKMAHYMIDNGVDLILGSHPHIVQGIEKYKNRYIVYSLSNFTFGANQNPPDKDTLIFQQEFTFENGELKLDDNINIIPASQSGVRNRNNYQPVVLEGSEKERVLQRILKNSSGFEYKYDNEDY